MYRLDRTSATCLLATDWDGWSLGEGPCGFGSRNDFTNLAKTWPMLGMTHFVQGAPWDEQVQEGEGPDDDLVALDELRAHVELAWDHRHQTFWPSVANSRTGKEILALLRDPTGFVEQRAQDEVFLARVQCPLTKKQVKRSAWWNVAPSPIWAGALLSFADRAQVIKGMLASAVSRNSVS